ncbi:hypothetical protein GCM10027408_03390 [Microbacterium tumbae]
MNWLLPIFVCFHGWLGGGGWETLALSVLSPVIVPVAGLLGSLPRFLLRRRSHRRTPAPIVWLLFTNWWSWFVFAAAMSGATDGAPLDSMLRSVVPAPLSMAFEYGILLGGAGIGVLSWLVILLLAIGLRTDADGAGRGGVVLGWIAAFGVPALLGVIVILGVQTTLAQTDAAGQTMAESRAVAIGEQADAARARYAAAQERLADVRALIADDGWVIQYYGLSTASPESRLRDGACYGIEVSFMHPSAGTRTDIAAIEAALAGAGWTRLSEGDFVDAEGGRLEIQALREGEVQVTYENGIWWGDPYDLRDPRSFEESDAARARTYRADEWPPF